MEQPDAIIITGSGVDCSFSQTNRKDDKEDNLIEEEYNEISSILLINTSLSKLNKIINLQIKKRQILFLHKLSTSSNKTDLCYDMNYVTKLNIISNLTNLLSFYKKNKQFPRLYRLFKHWRDVNVYSRISQNLINEVEIKTLRKYQNKNSSLEMTLAKLDKENFLLTEQLKEYQRLEKNKEESIKMSESNIRLLEDKLSKEQQNTNQIRNDVLKYQTSNKSDNKIFLDKKYSTLCDDIHNIKEQMKEKDNIISNYIQEQNEILDYQEKKFKELAEKTKSGVGFYSHTSSNAFTKVKK